MASEYEFDWVDAFTETPFGGNGCVVVHDAAGVDEKARMALVRETSLAECAYMQPSEKADFGVRYYLANKEIKMAGHPTIATVASLLKRGMVTLEGGRAAFTLEVGAGVLPIEVREREGRPPLITMTQARPVFGRRHDRADIARLYGLIESDIVAPPRAVSTGTGFCITVLRSHEALKVARLDLKAWEKYRPRADFMEPFLTTLTGATAEGQTFSRLLLPPPMPAEDPFTGSATGCLGAYLWAERLIDEPRFTAEQGHWMGRPGRAEVEVLGPREAIDGVKVSGAGVVLMEGRVRL